MHHEESLYDQNDYYADDARASRLTPLLNPLLRFLDHRKARSLMRRYGRKGGSVLDVGAGDGKFLAGMRRAGMIPTGTSASRRSCEASAALYGIPLQHRQDLPPAPTGGFDLITYWHVFEHLEDPPSHIRAWRKRLRPGGRLIIEVPDPASYGARLCYRSWLGSDPVHHINMVSTPELEKAVRDAGLQTVAREHFSLKFSYVFLWSAFLGRIFPRQRDFDKVLDLIKSPLARLRSDPAGTLNAWLAVFYLAPVILPVMLAGVIRGRGEVIRLVAIRPGDSDPSF